MRGSSGIQVEITFASMTESFVTMGAVGSGYVAGTNAAADFFEVSNIEYHADMVYFSQDFNSNFLLSLQKNGGLQIHGVSYSHSTHVSGSTKGLDEIPISHRHKSVKCFMSCYRDNSTMNTLESYNMTKRICPGMTDYCYVIGGIQYPEYAIKLAPGNNEISEALTQVELCFGKLGDRTNASCFDRMNFAPILSKAGKAQNVASESKTIMAVELETYGSHSSLLESGVNTSSRAPNCVFRCNKTGGTNLAFERIDSFAMYDFLVTILPDLTVSSQS
jgi:hypothetical protein